MTAPDDTPRTERPCGTCGHLLSRDQSGRWRDHAGHCRCPVGDMPLHTPAEGGQR